jgi:hypothetical protein
LLQVLVLRGFPHQAVAKHEQVEFIAHESIRPVKAAGQVA